MSISVFIRAKPTLVTFMEKSPENALAKSVIKLWKVQRREASRTRELLHVKRHHVYKEDMTEEIR